MVAQVLTTPILADFNFLAAILTAEITFVAEQVYVLLPINTVKG